MISVPLLAQNSTCNTSTTYISQRYFSPCQRSPGLSEIDYISQLKPFYAVGNNFRRLYNCFNTYIVDSPIALFLHNYSHERNIDLAASFETTFILLLARRVYRICFIDTGFQQRTRTIRMKQMTMR
jgi:hypothetical protein